MSEQPLSTRKPTAYVEEGALGLTFAGADTAVSLAAVPQAAQDGPGYTGAPDYDVVVQIARQDLGQGGDI